jgi:hypothetical protein
MFEGQIFLSHDFKWIRPHSAGQEGFNFKSLLQRMVTKFLQK